MRRSLLLWGVVALGLTARAADDQAFWGVFVETFVNRTAGVPQQKLPPGMDPAMLQMLPPEARAMLAGMGGPQRKLTMRCWSPGIAPAGATAVVDVPDGLKLGRQLNLDLYRPQPVTGQAGTPGGPGQPGQSMPGKFTIKRYWGSSPTVKAGQPEVTVIEWDKLSVEERAEQRRRMAEASGEESYYYKPDWTTAYWPTKAQPGAIDPAAVMAGPWRLRTSYTGEVAIDVPASVGFLGGIEFSSPNLDQKPDLTKALAFRWPALANVLGYHAQIMGMIGQDTLIIWSAAEARPTREPDWDFMQMAEVRQFVAAQQMLPGEATSMTAPAGIFADCDFVNLTMIGYGTGTARDDAQPRPRVQTKTTFSGLLGGKQMAALPTR